MIFLAATPVSTSTPLHLIHNQPQITPQKNSSSFNCAVSMVHNPRRRRCELYDLHDEVVPYAEAWSWQNEIVKERKLLNGKAEDFGDTLIILQHHPVYTLGAGSSKEFLNFDVENAPFDLYRTERGGEVTYHGPGQLVMYPIINLRYHQMDLHWYLRALEEVVIRSLSSAFNIEASRVDGLTGVWVGNQKIAAIGVKVSQWITYHGLALNITTDLMPFQRIVPCGIRDRQVGSVKGLLNDNFMSTWGKTDDCELINITHESLIREFCEVFQVQIEHKSVHLGEVCHGKTV